MRVGVCDGLDPEGSSWMTFNGRILRPTGLLTSIFVPLLGNCVFPSYI